MYAHLTTYTKQGKKVHMIDITKTPRMSEGSQKHTFESAREAKQFAKKIGAQAWNY